jgi:monoamine oxidase
VVVGAGIAGLTVARTLTDAGVDSVVVEARDRWGGRLHTVDLAGSAVDLGGSWIHHPIGNPLRAFAEQAGVPCRGGNPLTAMSAFDCGEGRRLSAEEVDASLDLALEQFPSALERLRAQLGPDASVATAIDAYVSEADLPEHEARRARQALRATVEADGADMSERHSLRWLWNELEYDGDFFGDLPTGGYRSIVDAMATSVDVRLGFDVAEVVVSDDGVEVRSGDGRTETGSHVVVTVPLGVLKRGVPAFSPALPAERVATIERLGFGRYEKVALRFDEPFWHDAGLSHLMIFPSDPDESTLWVFDQHAFAGDPTLVCHTFASTAGHVLDGSPDDAVRWFLDLLAQAIGRPCPAPSAVVTTSWSNDPFCGGAYTHVPPGATPADADVLGEPVGGRLLFAGEHTQSARLGYADGAMSSGLREARRLLRRSLAVGEPAD